MLPLGLRLMTRTGVLLFDGPVNLQSAQKSFASRIKVFAELLGGDWKDNT